MCLRVGWVHSANRPSGPVQNVGTTHKRTDNFQNQGWHDLTLFFNSVAQAGIPN